MTHHDLVEVIRRAQRLSQANRRRFIAGVGEHLAGVYSRRLDSSTRRLVQRTVDVLWDSEAPAAEVDELRAAWESAGPVRYIEISVGFASFVYFFRLSLGSLADAALIDAPLQYMANAVVYLSPPEPSMGGLTIIRPTAPNEWSVWAITELTWQESLLELTETEERSGLLLTRTQATSLRS